MVESVYRMNTASGKEKLHPREIARARDKAPLMSR